MSSGTRPSVSVALCTHNGARFVERQLTSILGQSVEVSEIVVSDDASTDGTLEVVEAVAARLLANGPVIRVLRNQRALGVAANFEQAIGACSGALVALSDQDDEWHWDRLEVMLAELDRTPQTTLLHSNARLIDADGRDLGVDLLHALDVTRWERSAIAAGQAFAVLLRRNLVTGATTLFRRELADLAFPVPHGWIHDEWLAIVAAATGRVTLLDRELTDYRQHGGNEIGAAKLGVRGRLERLREQGVERNQRILVRAESLARRFGEGRPSVPPEVVVVSRLKVEHERMRSSLSRHRLLRVGPVFCESRSGAYRRFGRGWIDVVRDLVQPL